MKKIMYLLLTLVISFSLISCSSKSDDEEIMTVGPSEFSVEATEMLSFVDDDIFYFDFTADKTVDSYTITTYKYEMGEWVQVTSLPTPMLNENNKTRIRMTYENDGFTYEHFVKTANGFSSKRTTANLADASFTMIPGFYTNFSNMENYDEYRILENRDIVLGEEVLLWMMAGSKDGEELLINTENFKETVCSAGVAYTITFTE